MAGSPYDNIFGNYSGAMGSGGSAPINVQAAQPSRGKQLADWFNTPTGQAVIGMAGSGLQSYAQGKQHEEDNALAQNRWKTQLQYDQFNQDRADQLRRAGMAADADPLGASQKYAQRNALMSAILPGMRSSNIMPTNANIASRMPEQQGGIFSVLPQGGFDPEMIKSKFGDAATMEALAQRQKQVGSINPNAPQTDLSMLYGDQAKPVMSAVQNWANANRSDLANQRTGLDGAAAASELDAHKAAKDDDWLEKNSPAPQGYHWHDGELSENGSGFWHKLAKYGGIAGAGVATAMTGGAASPLLIAAIGAGGGAASGWGSGGGAKGALLGAAGGAVPGIGAGISSAVARQALQAGAGAGIGAAQGGAKGALLGGAMGAVPAGGSSPATGMGFRNAAQQTFLDPKLYSQIAGDTLPGPYGAAASPLINAILSRRINY